MICGVGNRIRVRREVERSNPVPKTARCSAQSGSVNSAKTIAENLCETLSDEELIKAGK